MPTIRQLEARPRVSPVNSFRVDVADRGRALPEQGNFNWIRHKNEENHRRARRDIAALTKRAIENSGYMFGDSVVDIERTTELVAGTRLVSPSVGEWPANYNGVPSDAWLNQTNVRSVK